MSHVQWATFAGADSLALLATIHSLAQIKLACFVELKPQIEQKTSNLSVVWSQCSLQIRRLSLIPYTKTKLSAAPSSQLSLNCGWLRDRD